MLSAALFLSSVGKRQKALSASVCGECVCCVWVECTFFGFEKRSVRPRGHKCKTWLAGSRESVVNARARERERRGRNEVVVGRLFAF